MIEILSFLRRVSECRKPRISARDRAQIKQKVAWQQSIIRTVARNPEPYQPSVQSLAEYLGCSTSDSSARQYANQMLVQYRG